MHCLDLVDSKYYLNLRKNFLLRQFKMVAYKTMCTRLEQRSVINLLLAEKCKTCEIYWRICNVYREESFSQKMFTNGLNKDFPLWDTVEKTVHRVEAHWLSSNKNVPTAVVSKEGHADSLQGHKKTHFYWFLWKRCNCKQWFLLWTL